MGDRQGLLSDITILSIEQATTLPFLTYRLACDGARVVRVENPRAPDPNRFVGADMLGEEGMTSYYFINNTGKQAVTLNLNAPEGRAILHDLITRLPVDIFASNLRPRSYAKLGIDYETLYALKPDLIWLGITGFGPDNDEAAYDPILQARTGLMDITGEPDGPPEVIGLPIVDLGAAEHAYAALLKALYRRQKTGEGTHIAISMFHSALSWMVSPVMLTALGETITRRGNRHQYFAPVNTYPTSDGYAYLAVGNDRQWAAITQLLGFEELAEEAYTHNAGRIEDVSVLDQKISAITCRLTTAELVNALKEIGVPVSQVNAVADTLDDPLLRERLVRVTDPQTGFVITLPPDAALAGPYADMGFPPRLGEHNDVIYGESLGFSANRLAELKAEGII